MYRDFIEAPEKITAGGRDWWMQVLHHRDESVDVVNVFDKSGDFAADFQSVEDALAWIAQRA